MKKDSREKRNLIFVNPAYLDEYANESGIWFESNKEARVSRRRCVRHRRRFAWVRAAMALHLTGRQRECVTLHYLHGKSFREIGELLGMHHGTVHRHCARGIGILRGLAGERRRVKEKAGGKIFR